MLTELFTIALVFLAAGFLIPVALAARDLRRIRTLSLLLTVAAASLLGFVSFTILLGGGTITCTAYQPVTAFSLSFLIPSISTADREETSSAVAPTCSSFQWCWSLLRQTPSPSSSSGN